MAELYDDTLRPAEFHTTATPGKFCQPCTAAGRVGRVAYRIILKHGKPVGYCNDCWKASQARRPEPAEDARTDLIDEAIENPEDLEGLEEEPERLETHQKREVKVMPKAIEVDIKQMVKDYRAGDSVKELCAKYGIKSPAGVYQRLHQAGISTKRRPAEAARLPRASKPSTAALARVARSPLGHRRPKFEADPEEPNGRAPEARIKFRVIECELSAGSDALTEGLRALTTALKQDSK